MNQNTETFNQRLARIQRERRGNRGSMGFIVHPDGVVTALGRPNSRLRFGFPLRGLFISLVIAVAVKGYLMWALGIDVYTVQISLLLEGSSLERAAGLVLMPDTLTLWVSDRYADLAAFIQGGIAASR